MPAITKSGNVLTKKPTKIEETNSVGFEYVINETTLLNKLKTVDGKGSGLDTDLVRGDYINPRMFKNRIINGDFSIWQRGEDFLFGTPDSWVASTSYGVGNIVIPTTANGFYYECTVAGTSGSSEPIWPTNVGDTVTDNEVTWVCKGVQYDNFSCGYTADRFASQLYINQNDGGLFKVVKSSFLNKNSIKFEVLSPPTDLSGENYWHGLRYIFEGQQLYDLAINNKTITVSFWFKSNVTGKYSVSLINVTNNTLEWNTYVTTFDYTTADIPQKIELIIPLDTSWSILANNNQRGFFLTIGRINYGDFATTITNQWTDEHRITTSDCVNWAATAGNYIEIAELQLEEGEVATDFEHVPYDVQLMRCQRYYEKGMAVGVYPKSGNDTIAAVEFRVIKRTIPTIIIKSMDGTVGKATYYWWNGSQQSTEVDLIIPGCGWAGNGVTKDYVLLGNTGYTPPVIDDAHFKSYWYADTEL